MQTAYAQLEGHYAFALISEDQPELLVAARRECPLVIGRGDGEQYLASAIPGFLSSTRSVQYIGNDEIVVLTEDEVEIRSATGGSRQREIVMVDWDEETAERAGHETFMLKEIREQGAAIQATLAGRLHQSVVSR